MAEHPTPLAGRQTSGSGGGSGLMNFLQRPELWQWLGGVGAGMSRASRGQGYDISGANQQLFQGMKERKQGAAFDMMLKNLPEGTINAAQMTFIKQVPAGIRQKVLGGWLTQSGKDDAIWKQKMKQMDKMGTSPEIASGIATGRLVWKTDPVEGTSTLYDSRTGKPYDYGNTNAVPTPTPTPVDDGTPEDAVDYPAAFGIKGMWNHFWNQAFDFLGFGQSSPEAATARRQFENINVQTATLLAEGVDVRGGKYLLDRFDEIQAQAGGIQGPVDALKTIKEMEGLLQRSYEVHQSVIDSPVKPAEKSQSTAAMRRLEPLLAEYKQIIKMFESQMAGAGAGGTLDMRAESYPESGSAPEGITDDEWQYLTPEEQAEWLRN